MPAIVLDQEHPEEETGGRDHQQQRQPIAALDGSEHEAGEREERQQGNTELEQAAADRRLPIGRELAHQPLRIDGRDRRRVLG